MRLLLTSIALVFALVTSASAEPPHRRGYGHSHGQAEKFWGGVLGGILGTYWWNQANRPRDLEVEDQLVPWSEPWLRFCTRRYRSFDPQSGTYLSYDGNRYFCK